MTLLNPKDEDEEEKDVSCMQTDITDEEMALRYTSSSSCPPQMLFDRVALCSTDRFQFWIQSLTGARTGTGSKTSTRFMSII